MLLRSAPCFSCFICLATFAAFGESLDNDLLRLDHALQFSCQVILHLKNELNVLHFLLASAYSVP